jgi:hypothetical protein
MSSDRESEVACGLGQTQRCERSTLTPSVYRARSPGSRYDVGEAEGSGGGACGSEGPCVALDCEHDSQDGHGQRKPTDKRGQERAYGTG